MKKFLIGLIMVGMFYSPIGTNVVNVALPAKYKQVQKVSAKGYRSPGRSFRPGNNGVRQKNNKPSNFNNNQTSNKRNSFFGGGRGLLGGLMLGGLAGLLFGGFLSNMGGFGQFLGLLINLLAIYLVVRLVILFFQKRKQVVTASGPTRGYQHYQSQSEKPFAGAAVQGPSIQPEEEKTILDEGNISNAVISFFTHQKGMSLEDVEVILTYDEDKGYGAEVIKNGEVLEKLDHFSLVQAIRYWAVEYANLNPNVGIRFEFSQLEGITAILA